MTELQVLDNLDDNKTTANANEEATRCTNASKIDEFNQTKLSFFHALGYCRTKHVNLQHLENEESIIYLAGKHMAQYNYEKRTHKFILKSARTREICSFAVSYGKKYVALSERLYEDNVIQVSVYNFKQATRVRTIPFSNSKGPIVSMDFSRDSKFLACVTANPDSTISLWSLEKSKKIGSCSLAVPASQISINPFSHWQLCTTGQETCKIWRHTEGELKSFDPLPNSKYTFTCHTWFDDEKLLVGTEEGNILVIIGTEVKKVIPSIQPNSPSVDCILSIDRGFICGGSDGQLTVFERTYDADYFLLYKKFQAQEKSRIIDICISKREENVICCFESNQLAHFNMSNMDVCKEKDNNFTFLPIGFHGDMITGVDICIQRPIVITSGADKVLRLWNYARRKVELSKEFSEDIHSVSIHPSGDKIVVAFKKNVVLFNILIDNFHECCKWQLKGCKIVKFSSGGQYFAVSQVSNILLFSVNTFQVITTLKGHSGIVRSLSFSDDDRNLVSAGSEGAMYEWGLDFQRNLTKNNREEGNSKPCSFHSLAYDDKSCIAAIIGDDQKVWCFQRSEFMINIECGTELTSLCLGKSSKTLFVGTQDGRLLLFKWPLENFHYREYEVHNGAVSHVILSIEEKYLFSIGLDGSLYMFEVESIVESKFVDKKEFNFELVEDLTYCLKSSLNEKTIMAKELEEKLGQVKNETERQLQTEVEEKHKAIETEKKHFKEDIDHLNHQIEVLKHQLDENETLFKEKQNRMESSQLKWVEEIEQAHEQRVTQQQKKFDELQKIASDRISDMQDEIKYLKEQQALELQRVRAEYISGKQKQDQFISSISNDFEHFNKSYQQQITQESTEHESEMAIIRDTFQTEMKKEMKKAADERSKAIVESVKVKERERQIEQLNQLLAQKENQLKIQKKQQDETQSKIRNLELQIQQKDDINATSEKKITDLKKQSSDLEKLRYVLTYKFNSLRNEVTPKEELIEEMRARLRGVDTELQLVNNDKVELTNQVKNRDERIHFLENELQKQKQSIEKKSRVLTSLVRELSEFVAIGDPKVTNHEVKKIITRFNVMLKKNLDMSKSEQEKMDEIERHRVYMEERVHEMRKNLRQKEKNTKADVYRMTSENSELVQEVNLLRHERKMLLHRIHELEQIPPHQTQHPIEPKPLLTSRTSLSRVRTPDSFFSIPSARSSARQRGQLIKGNTWSRESTGLNRLKVHEVVEKIEQNTKRFEKQQESIGRLNEYVKQLVSKVQQPVDAGDGSGMSAPITQLVSQTPLPKAQQLSLIDPTSRASADEAQNNVVVN